MDPCTAIQKYNYWFSKQVLSMNRYFKFSLGAQIFYAFLLSIKRLVITMTPATPTATATVPQPTATTMSIMSEERLLRFVFPV